MTPRVLVCGVGPWSAAAFRLHALPGWRFASTEQLMRRELRAYRPEWIALLHWRWRVPPDIHESIKTIGFHMTDLPKGRGGSPLQHLILARKKSTTLCAFKVGAEMDAGPVYLRQRLVLDGTAAAIYSRATHLAMTMVNDIVTTNIIPKAQVGVPTFTKRRTPEQSEIPESCNTMTKLIDFIRMLDAEGYPHAFLRAGRMRLEFTGAWLEGTTVRASVRFIKEKTR